MDNNYFLDFLIPFDLLIDTDIGVLKVLEKYNGDKDYFEFTRLDDNNGRLNEDMIRFLLIYRTNPNPLYLITDTDLIEEKTIDNIYNNIIDTNYKEVLEYAEETSIYRIFSAGSRHQETPFRLTIICKNTLEISYLKEKKLKCDTILISDNKDLVNIDLDRYKYIIVKNIDTLLDFKYMEDKVIYIANYRFNKSSTTNDQTGEVISVLKPELVVDIMEDNIIKIIDVYPIPNDILL